MATGPVELPRRDWQHVLILTTALTLIGTVISVAAADTVMRSFGEGLSGAGLAVSMALPVVIGARMSFVHLLRGAQLKRANERLEVLASTDWLTSCLNRRAFTTMVDACLSAGGALLVIDADHFKEINDRFGHDRGDDVLQLIAATIRDSVREGDIVGRIGGEEFGVFLIGADQTIAATVAERIRLAVQQLNHAPDGARIPISVSVGGVACSGETRFSDLFRAADQRLYGVKQAGRNRTDLGPADASDTIELVAPAAA